MVVYLREGECEMAYADAAWFHVEAQQARIAELEARLAEMEAMYDKVATDLIEALDAASAYRATASTLHQEIERRNGWDRRTHLDIDKMCQMGWRRSGLPERRKSWPR
jgi:hypothetical protein